MEEAIQLLHYKKRVNDFSLSYSHIDMLHYRHSMSLCGPPPSLLSLPPHRCYKFIQVIMQIDPSLPYVWQAARAYRFRATAH